VFKLNSSKRLHLSQEPPIVVTEIRAVEAALKEMLGKLALQFLTLCKNWKIQPFLFTFLVQSSFCKKQK